MLFDYRNDSAIDDKLSFLVTKKAEKTTSDNNNKDKEDNKLPSNQLQSSEDIAVNKRVMKQLLRSHSTQDPHGVWALLVKQQTLT